MAGNRTNITTSEEDNTRLQSYRHAHGIFIANDTRQIWNTSELKLNSKTTSAC